MIIRKLILFAAFLLPTIEAAAICAGGGKPTPQEEFRSSGAVVVGHVLGHQDLTEDPSDPDGVTATLYHVDVRRRLKGDVGRSLQLRSENTSSRFPMEAGEDYLLFLSKDGAGYFVDGCGNSTEFRNAASVLSKFGEETVARAPVAAAAGQEALIGRDYASARKMLIKDRWVPVRHTEIQTMEHDRKIQRKYPEMDSCAIDKPVCSFSFKRAGKCARIITWGEEMKAFKVDAVVHDCLDGAQR